MKNDYKIYLKKKSKYFPSINAATNFNHCHVGKCEASLNKIDTIQCIQPPYGVIQHLSK